MTQNEFYFESQYRKIMEKMELEKEEQSEIEKKKKNNQLEVATEVWINQFIKPEYRLTFMAILRFKFGQNLRKRRDDVRVLWSCGRAGSRPDHCARRS